MELASDQLTLTWADPNQKGARLRLKAGLTIQAGRWLCLDQPVATWADELPLALADLTFDLGPEVEIERLTITVSTIELEGRVRVIPAD
ncbi:MAG: hypothetical protein HC922_02270 [Leptolyngbyaceae cyanobacterium SM2_3_12]|nr:hypothetical protein [Leptolyngbyaceae cyanobacterium SM2_3_12]